MSKKRDAEFDIAKGILILCVVIGHGGSDSIADFMYRFHMPLFFILSGYFLQKKSDVGEYAKKQFMKLMIPYFLYMSIDFVLFDHLHNLNRVLHYLWGGRFINGVYWYITCFYIWLLHERARQASDQHCGHDCYVQLWSVQGF